MLPLIGAAIGGLTSFLGGQSQNAANAQQAQKQMDFQERMSNTSYQRATDDMRKAGLNPALAYQQGGAPAPQGASAQMHNTAGNAVTSAASAAATTEAINTARAQQDALTSEGQLKRAQAQQVYMEQAFRIQELQENINSTRTHARESAGRLREIDVRRLLHELSIPEARNAANAQGSWWKRNVAPYLGDANALTRMLPSILVAPRIGGRRTGKQVTPFNMKDLHNPQKYRKNAYDEWETIK